MSLSPTTLNDFPRRVGIVFLEGLETDSKEKTLLNFDQNACSYLLLQLNAVQRIFEFNIINTGIKDHSLPSQEELQKEYNNDIRDWFDNLVLEEDKNLVNKIRCWIGITSEPIPGDLFSTSRYKKDSKSQTNIALITTHDWERSFSPPSVFEYMLIGIFKTALLYLSNDLGNYLHYHHKSITRGCIYDVVWTKSHRRFAISTPNLCIECVNKIKRLEQTVNEKSKEESSLHEQISKILDKKWMGTPDERNTPLFNLKKDYKYDIDRNSGLYKNFFERFRDSTVDNLPQWIIGTLISGVIGGLLILLGLKK